MDETPKGGGGEGRRRSTSTNSSPEFEFWVTRNRPEPDQLLSADELFVDGVLLPLHLLHAHPDTKPERPDPPPTSQPDHISPSPSTTTETDPAPVPGQPSEASSSSSSSISGAPTSGLTASKRWKDILFKKTTAQTDDRIQNGDAKDKEKKKKSKSRDKKGSSRSGSGSGSGSAELNINIWPFSRSRSAGNGGTRPKLSPPGSTRKVSSAPCSRSNSAGESKSRKWPSSPGRVHGGVYLGRSSPVWQVRRSGSRDSTTTAGLATIYSDNGGGPSNKEVTDAQRGKKLTATEDGDSSEGRNRNVRRNTSNKNSNNKAKVLNLNVPKCIGYRHHLGACRADEASAVNGGSGGDKSGSGGGNGASVGGGNLFHLRSLFGKKVY